MLDHQKECCSNELTAQLVVNRKKHKTGDLIPW